MAIILNSLGVLTLAIVLIMGAISLSQRLIHSERCPSCYGRFGHDNLTPFCTIGDKQIFICKKCTDDPQNRLGVDNSYLKDNGFTPLEISELQNQISLYRL